MYRSKDFFHRRRQVSPPVNNLTHRFFDGSQHFLYCNFTVGSRHSAVASSSSRSSMIKQHEQLAEQFFSGNAATYDQIASFSTLGLDGWWKRKILNKIPKTSNGIIEQASGTGILTCKSRGSFPSAEL
jgi:hypothetical protein